MNCIIPGLLSPGVFRNLCPLNQWCHATFSSSVTLFSCPQSFPALGSFLKSWLFALGGHCIGASDLASVLPMNIQGWFPFRIDWFNLLAVQGTLRSLLQHHTLKESVLQLSAFFMVQLSHLYMTTEKTIALTIWTFVGKVMSLLWNMLCRFVIVFLPRSKCLLISWWQSPFPVILEPKKIKSVTVSIVFPSICCEVMGPDAVIFVLWMLSFKPAFHSPLSHSSRSSLVLLCFLT